ncbi:MAG: glycine cleavage system protein GcvH [Flavobacteriales bacterium]|jgi:glycine cleavage system H protein|nr:glycine cleavage system protein GcvH [Flavobacteriales bacterium]MBT3962746.1 glycine cleavage system protein GcvH [Flavobacteriales bacterium]MBT4705903.1 glycine cleavage system protein GcvH [Flavobacteriales bacterium]MBT4929571.1 glycine cleavage system protein GcvH [Flavobacteriales bacterium]MBT5131689.1 glycine cleavage system protein GcvH [Flavobacteriales bacterium]
MNIPEDLKYTSDHEWIRVEGDTATVGITDYAQGELGDVVYVEIETEGESLDREEVFGTVEAVKTVSDLFMPISGEVVAVNESLADAPDTVNKDPYGEGWMIKIKYSDSSELDALLSADDYKSEVGA